MWAVPFWAVMSWMIAIGYVAWGAIILRCCVTLWKLLFRKHASGATETAP